MGAKLDKHLQIYMFRYSVVWKFNCHHVSGFAAKLLHCEDRGYISVGIFQQLATLIHAHGTTALEGVKVPMTFAGLRSHLGMLCTRCSGLAQAGTSELPPLKARNSANTTM